MILEYQVLNPAVQEIEAKLKELSLAYTKKQKDGQKKPVLVDGREKINGHKAILDHLGTIAGELNSWYYCDC